MSLRILIHSNCQWCSSGYGKATANLVTQFQRLGHTIAVSSVYGLQGGILKIDGVEIYPAGLVQWGNDILPSHAAKFDADMVLCILDLFVFDDNLGVRLPGKLVIYTPLDGEPWPQAFSAKGASAEQVILYSKHAKAQADQAGFPTIYIPLGFDPKIYHPICQTASESKKVARDLLNYPEDLFLVGMVAANQSYPDRKAFKENIEGFMLFRERHTNALLYIHTDPLPIRQGIDLKVLVNMMGAERFVRFPDRYLYHLGFSEREQSIMYNAFDVLLACASGEGFGMPLIESQSCGTPVLATDFSAMSELVFAGKAVPILNKEFYALGVWHARPDPRAIAEGLEEIYQADREKLSKQAVSGVEKFDWQAITETYWKPYLERFEEKTKKLFVAALPQKSAGLPSLATDFLRVVVIPTWRCSLGSSSHRCPYCDYFPSRDGSIVNIPSGRGRRNVGPELTVEQWLEFFSKLPPAQIEFSGGEPLCYDGIIDLINRIPERHKVAITTSLVRQPLRLQGITNPNLIAITASFHLSAPGYLSDPLYFRSLLKRIRQDCQFNIAVTVVAYPEHIDKLPQMVNIFSGFPINIHPFLSKGYDPRGDLRMLKCLVRYKNLTGGQNQVFWDEIPANTFCSAGRKILVVEPDGVVYPCYSSMFFGLRTMGSALDPAFVLLKGSEYCTQPCVFPCDIINKELENIPTITIASLVSQHERLADFLRTLQGIIYPADKLKYAFVVPDGLEIELGKLSDSVLVARERQHHDLTRHEKIVMLREQLRELALETGSDYILFTDSDIVHIPRNAIKLLVSSQSDVIAPLVLLEDSNLFYDTWAFQKGGLNFSNQPPYHLGLDSNPLELDSVGTFYLARRDVALRSSYSSSMKPDHVSFCKSARSNGYRIMLNPSVKVWHSFPDKPHTQSYWEEKV